MSAKKKALGNLRQLQLASANLPVGGYTFSQGLEYAVDACWITDVSSMRDWIHSAVCNTLIYTDIPILKRSYDCVDKRNWKQLDYWNQLLLAMRETKELQLAETAMADGLLRLCDALNVSVPNGYELRDTPVSYLTLYGLLAYKLEIELIDACTGYGWTVLESQVMAATKLLPMGQTNAQKMLIELSADVAEAVQKGLDCEDQRIGRSMPGLAFVSAKHESQYSRLYRS